MAARETEKVNSVMGTAKSPAVKADRPQAASNPSPSPARRASTPMHRVSSRSRRATCPRSMPSSR